MELKRKICWMVCYFAYVGFVVLTFDTIPQEFPTEEEQDFLKSIELTEIETENCSFLLFDL